MKKSLINIFSISVFFFCGLLLSAQDFRGGDIRCTYIVSPLEVNINVNLYFHTEEELGLDTIVMRTAGGNYVMTVDEIIPVNRGISIYRYNQDVLYISLGGQNINVLPTPPVEVDHLALIEDSLAIPLLTYYSNSISSIPPFDTTFATWDDFLFDYAIDEAGDLVFQLSGTDPDGDGGVAFGFSVELLFWRDQGWYEYPAPLEDLQLNTETGAFRWRNPPGPGKYLLGFDLHGLFPNSTVLNNMFTRYLVIELTEEDFITDTHTNDLVTPELVIFPNPATHSIQVTYASLNGNGSLSVINLEGQTIHKAVLLVNSSTTELDVSTWPAGIYFVKLESSKGSVVRKLIVE
ncbi:T9SS type A sorting domain-containing protein [Lewinella cohaerens]|uniref:T9SS type A sorting domain-containing protein n=1 Tax=Lewinella cohaerens TaxID=70995 RepID=UPI0003685B6A|nr:T9SS type A sorting domain-containing protein [Lewinella cohaerens]